MEHVNELRFTADGNFQLNQYRKNADDEATARPELWGGSGYFVSADEIETHLAKVGNTSQVSSRAISKVT